MSDFDPYHIWLGIPETERPISKYRLLGIGDFEDNRDVISTAAERQTVFLRTMQAGEHAILVAELLNEVSQARVTLLNADQKAAYDEELRKQQTPEPVPEPTSPPNPVVQTPAPTPVVVRGTVTQEFPVSVVQPTKRPRRRKPKKIWERPAVIGVSVVGVIGVLALFISMMSSGDAEPVASKSPPAVNLPSIPTPESTPAPQSVPKLEPVPASKPKVMPQKGFRNNSKGYTPKPTPQPEPEPERQPEPEPERQPEPEPERQPEPAMKRLEALGAILSGREALAKRDFDSVSESLTRVESFVLSTDLKGPYDRLKMMHKLVKNFDLKLRETLENLKPGNSFRLSSDLVVEVISIDSVEIEIKCGVKSKSHRCNDLPLDIIVGLVLVNSQSTTRDDFYGFAAYIGTLKSEHKSKALKYWRELSTTDNHYESDVLSIYLLADLRLLSLTDVEAAPVPFIDLSDVMVPCKVKNAGQHLDIDTHDNLSIAIWVQTGDADGRQVLLAKENMHTVNSGYPCYRLELNNGVPKVTINDQDYNQTSFIAKDSVVALPTGINGWHHLCFVIDKHSPEKSLLFIDGGIKQLDVKKENKNAIHTVGSLQNDGDLYLGWKYNGTEGGDFLFLGKLALTKLYRTKLTERQVKSIVSAERTLVNK